MLILEEKLREYLRETWESEKIGDYRKEWIYGAVMGAYAMGVIDRDTRQELLKEYMEK